MLSIWPGLGRDSSDSVSNTDWFPLPDLKLSLENLPSSDYKKKLPRIIHGFDKSVQYVFATFKLCWYLLITLRVQFGSCIVDSVNSWIWWILLDNYIPTCLKLKRTFILNCGITYLTYFAVKLRRTTYFKNECEGFIRFPKTRKHLNYEAAGRVVLLFSFYLFFIVFEQLETWWNQKHEFLKLFF